MIGFKIGNRWKIVLVATSFNLLFEYSMRGLNNLFLRPILPLFLFGVYFPYFAMLEDLIVRYRLKDYHIVGIGCFFGLISGVILPNSMFIPPLFLGVNWRNLFLVNLAWWGIVQGVLTFYIANRVAPRDWSHPLMSKSGWFFHYSH